MTTFILDRAKESAECKVDQFTDFRVPSIFESFWMDNHSSYTCKRD